MSHLLILVPIALGLGFAGLLGFIWCIRSGQFDDLEGSAVRILDDDGPDEEFSSQSETTINPDKSG